MLLARLLLWESAMYSTMSALNELLTRRTTMLISTTVALTAASVGFVLFRSMSLTILILAAPAASVAKWVKARRQVEAQSMTALESARTLLRQGEEDRAEHLASEVARCAPSTQTRNGALTTLAWAALALGHPERAKEAIDHIKPPYTVDLYCFAAVESALGKPRIAIEALELARTGTSLGCEAAKFLVDLYADQERFDRAVGAAIDSFDQLGVENCRAIVRAAFRARAFEPAATLAALLFRATCAPEDGVALIRTMAQAEETARVARMLDHVVGRLRRRGRLARARPLLAELRSDKRLRPSIRNQIERALDTARLG